METTRKLISQFGNVNPREFSRKHKENQMAEETIMVKLGSIAATCYRLIENAEYISQVLYTGTEGNPKGEQVEQAPTSVDQYLGLIAARALTTEELLSAIKQQLGE